MYVGMSVCMFVGTYTCCMYVIMYVYICVVLCVCCVCVPVYAMQQVPGTRCHAPGTRGLREWAYNCECEGRRGGYCQNTGATTHVPVIEHQAPDIERHAPCPCTTYHARMPDAMRQVLKCQTPKELKCIHAIMIFE